MKGHLIFKMNSLVDPILIAALYEASKNNVRVDLIVRGICCLKPGTPGLSENIFVRSIVGRFLEHSRAYYFYNNENDELYLSSADLMQRNLDRRVEVTFPVQDEHNKKELKKMLLDACLTDTEKSRILLPTGKYVRNKAVITQHKQDVHEWTMATVAAERS
jgi:polyphosphate kinase